MHIQREESLGEQLVVLDDSNRPLLFRDEDPSIRRKRHCHGELHRRIAAHLNQRETWRQIIGRVRALHRPADQAKQKQTVEQTLHPRRGTAAAHGSISPLIFDA